jgi:hypothetical protein
MALLPAVRFAAQKRTLRTIGMESDTGTVLPMFTTHFEQPRYWVDGATPGGAFCCAETHPTLRGWVVWAFWVW